MTGNTVEHERRPGVVPFRFESYPRSQHLVLAPRELESAKANAMANRTSVESTKVANRDAARRVAAKGSASKLIDRRITELGDWRGKVLQRVRKIIKEADPEIVEEWKWETPVWSHNGLVCTGETYKSLVKVTFAKGASLKDPSRLFNSSLEGRVRRAIDTREGDKINETALKALVRAGVALNLKGKGPSAAAQPVLLTGGNPQIAKAGGDAPVQAYIAAMPGWKREVGRRLDALIVRNVPNVRKAVKWNSPFYGIEGQGWFLAFHVFTRYVKVTFFRGTSLRPVPPGGTGKDARWIDIHEDDLDEAQMAAWVKQAAALPGWGRS
ncbi:MAG: DUF1801 domain-containing protein [Armatimonadota bacterium]|nr:DUF1801 domain-containing protein [Armatimonadota bacterium]